MANDFQVNRNQRVIGWYATGTEVTESLKIIHQMFHAQSQRSDILFLLVDAAYELSDRLTVKAYLSRKLGMPGGTEGLVFVPLEVEIESYGAERCAVDMMASAIDPDSKIKPELGDDMVHLYQLSMHLDTMLDQVIEYVESVLNGTKSADPKIGRAIAQLIFSMPKLDPQHLESLINSSYKDLLMVTYLSNLIRTHVKLLNLAQ